MAPYPHWFLEQIWEIAPHLSGQFAAQLLWQRGIREAESLMGFLQPEHYQPTGPEALGQEMLWAIDRLEQARKQRETVTLWGDFDADGVTATAVLWEGFGQFLPKGQLNYWIPNRRSESHGLNRDGIQSLSEQGTTLIMTCDTGSINLDEIKFANSLGIDVIITDHHTLPQQRPPVVAMINPRQFPAEHPLASLSGVAVAYKVVEAWYERSPSCPQQPLEELLDLVALGLIADWVELKHDCRYLAQMGLRKLKQRLQNPASRPGVAKLLQLCRAAGDRPTDLSFGIGPRINAISQMQEDASFCVELLTSRDAVRCGELAIETELAHSRRKELQQRVKKEAIADIATLDPATTQVIIVAKRHWPLGILGIVARDIAQAWNCPTLLLQLETDERGRDIARGSAHSVRGIDLYDLIAEHTPLFTRFGGHPFAAGMSLPAENIELLRQSLNQALRSQQPISAETPAFDLVITVAQLGQSLFKELQLLEPYGIGNRVPKLLIQNCWFENATHRNLRDRTGKQIRYIQTRFMICDDSSPQGFPGQWWEHYREDLPPNRCDAIVELGFDNQERRPEIRLVEVLKALKSHEVTQSNAEIIILDHRNLDHRNLDRSQNARVIRNCPRSWQEWEAWLQRSRLHQSPIVLAYDTEPELDAVATWRRLVGIVKTAIRTGEVVLRSHLQTQLQLSETTLNDGLKVLQELGIQIRKYESGQLQFSGQFSTVTLRTETLDNCLKQIEEERFQQRYFGQVSTQLLQTGLDTEP